MKKKLAIGLLAACFVGQTLAAATPNGQICNGGRTLIEGYDCSLLPIGKNDRGEPADQAMKDARAKFNEAGGRSGICLLFGWDAAGTGAGSWGTQDSFRILDANEDSHTVSYAQADKVTGRIPGAGYHSCM